MLAERRGTSRRATTSARTKRRRGTGDIEWEVTYSLDIGVPDTENTNQHMVNKFSIDITGDMDLDITIQWDRIGNPVPDSNGVTPQKDDFRWSLGLGWNF